MPCRNTIAVNATVSTLTSSGLFITPFLLPRRRSRCQRATSSGAPRCSDSRRWPALYSRQRKIAIIAVAATLYWLRRVPKPLLPCGNCSNPHWKPITEDCNRAQITDSPTTARERTELVSRSRRGSLARADSDELECERCHFFRFAAVAQG